MSKLDWPPPKPKVPQGAAYQRFVFPTTCDKALVPESGLSETNLANVVMRRRSGSFFSKPEPQRIEGLLAYSLSTLAVSISDPDRELRPVPSAGALHSLHLLLSEGESWCVYLPRPHVLRKVNVNMKAATLLRNAVREVLDPGQGLLMLILAEVGVLAARYDHPETLVLRDAGCLLGHLGLIAEALDLSYRILGPTGEPWAHQLVVGAPGVFVGVGTALVGGRSTSQP
jgi:hypothetical protein